jgi:hypothetical protein
LRTTLATFAFAATFAASPVLASTAAEILQQNKAASGGAAWDGKETLEVHYDYVGQGMTGKVESTADVRTGRYLDSYHVGPVSGATGYDGTAAWEKDPSGAVTPQQGASSYLAVNEAYRDANLWWRPDFGGATVSAPAEKALNGTTYDVLTVTPKNGGSFDAWFDARTHLLSRTEERQGSVTINTTYANYAAHDGVMLAGKVDQIASDGKNPQSQTLTSASFGPGRPVSFYAMPKVVLADAKIAGGAAETTFPFKLVNNHIYADVKVDGKGPYTFIFDTGGLNLVTPTLAKTLGLKVEGELDARGGGSGTMKAGMTRVKSVDLGQATISDQSFISLPLDSMAHIEGVDMPGMIGFETFRRFVTRIDYGNSTITLIDPKKFDPKDAGVAIPIAFDGNTIEIQGSYNGIPGKFIVDTGARQTLTLNSPFVAKHNLHDASVKSGEATVGWGVGGPTKAYVIPRGTLMMGSVEVHPLTMLTTDKGGSSAEEELAGNIGGGTLKRFVVTFDYERNVMYLKPIPGRIADLDTFDRSGMWFNRDAEGFKVVDVTTNTPAAEAGLAKDDVITAVDGKAAGSLSLPDLRLRLRNDAPGTVVTLSVKGKGEVKLTLRDLI